MVVRKIVELVGSSPKGWEEAVRNAVKEAAKTIRGIKDVWIQDFSALVEDGKIAEYRAHVKPTFLVETNRSKK